MRIVAAKPLADFRVHLRFDNGRDGVVDLSDFAGRGVFAAWNEPGAFEQLAVTAEGALQWPGEIDLCPDALYLKMSGERPEELFPNLQPRMSHA